MENVTYVVNPGMVKIDESEYLRLIPACLKTHFWRYHGNLRELYSFAYEGLKKGIKTYSRRRSGNIEFFLYQSIKWNVCAEIFRITRKKRGIFYYKDPKNRERAYREISFNGYEATEQQKNHVDYILLEQCYKKLSRREQTVLKWWMIGFNFAEIGRKLKVSREYIRQIFKRALLKLKRQFGQNTRKRGVKIPD